MQFHGFCEGKVLYIGFFFHCGFFFFFVSLATYFTFRLQFSAWQAVMSLSGLLCSILGEFTCVMREFVSCTAFDFKTLWCYVIVYFLFVFMQSELVHLKTVIFSAVLKAKCITKLFMLVVVYYFKLTVFSLQPTICIYHRYVDISIVVLGFLYQMYSFL